VRYRFIAVPKTIVEISRKPSHLPEVTRLIDSLVA
jgi:hypothetical protein